MNYDKQYYAYRRNSLYLSLFVSLFLMLFLLGMFGVILINAEYLNRYFKEKFTLTVYYKAGTPRSIIKQDEKRLKADTLVKKVIFISKEKAAERAKELLGEDFIAVLGENPLQDNLEIHLHAPYVNEQTVKNFKDRLMQNEHIDEVAYEQTVLELLDRNVRKIGMIVTVISALFLVVILLLIRNTVKLSLQTKRHVIKTMQLVGATPGFIMRPFLWKNTLTGLLAGLAASGVIWAGLHYVSRYLQALDISSLQQKTLWMLGGLVLFGMLLSLITTYFAARRILRMRTEEVHF